MWGVIWLKELHIYFSNYPPSQGLRKRARASRWVSLHLIGWEGGARPITGRSKALPLVSRISLEYWLKFPLNKFSITQSLHVDHEVHSKRVYRQVLTLESKRKYMIRHERHQRKHLWFGHGSTWKKVECLRLYMQALSCFDRNKTFIQSAMVS